ncbi:MAG: GerAB/ArcD/ProY family transporter [Bacillota bacterium]
MENSKLHPVQVLTITASTTLGVSILTVQQNLTSIAKQDAWISMILGGIIGLFAGLLIYYLSKKHSKLDLPEMTLSLAGSIIGRILLLPLAIYVPLDAGITIRVFAQALKLFLLDRTPVSVIALLMIIVLISVVVKGIGTIGGVVDILLPFFITTLTLLIVLSVTQFQTTNIGPVLFENTFNVVKGSLPAYGTLIGYGSIAYIMKYISEPKNVLKWFLTGFVISIILYILLTLVAVLVFGPEETQNLMFPTLFLSKSIEVAGTFFERLEAFMVIIWIPAVFTSVAVFTFASVRNFSVLFHVKPKYQKYIAYAHIPLLYIIAQYSKSELQALKYMHIVDYLGVSLGLVFVPLLVILTLIRNRRKKNA